MPLSKLPDAEAQCAQLAELIRPQLQANTLLVGIHSGGAWIARRLNELLGLPGGSLKPGSVADVIIIDLDVPWVLGRDDLKSKCKNTPFDEAKMTGRVVRTIVSGRTVYEFV